MPPARRSSGTDPGGAGRVQPGAADEPGLADLSRALHRLQRLLSSRRVHTNLVTAAGSALSQQAAQVLAAVGGETRTVADLARAAHMDVGAVSRQLRILEEEGLVTRAGSPSNGSIVLVAATAEGAELAARIAEVRQRQLVDALSGWDDDDRTRLGQLLARFVDDLQATPYRPYTPET